MSTPRRSRRTGFALIEALIALLLISIGLIAVAKLQTTNILGAGEGRARADAANLSQQKIEELRNLLQKSDFDTGALADGTYTATVLADTTKNRLQDYTLTWTISTPDATLEKRMVLLTTTWIDAKGVQQRLDMNTELAWDEPFVTATLLGSAAPKNLISPTGEAKRGGALPPGLSPKIENHDGSKIYEDTTTGKTYLTDKNGKVLLYLLPKNKLPQSFTRISGRVYFDPDGGNGMPPTNEVLVRLSSEGECIYNNAGTLPTVSSGGKTYSYLAYACYVGPGWYGNVGVTVVDTPGNNAKHNVCVGDPGFNGGDTNGTRTSAHPDTSTVRSYRGFRSTATDSGYQSTGVAGGRYYGTTFNKDGSQMKGPFDGRPRPSEDSASYGVVAPGSEGDYLNQDFLITDRYSNQLQCPGLMQGGPFAGNAGGFVCITPDAYGPFDEQSGGFADECPDDWPGYPSSGNTNTGTCSPEIKGSKIDGFGSVAVSTSDGEDYGTCPGDGGSKGFTCTFNGVPDDTVTFTLTNVPGTKSKPADYVGLQPLTFTLDCDALPPKQVFQTP